jgi:predicted nucleic acid-binding protein
VYIETTIVSLLVARPSRDLVIAGHQAETRQWWNERRAMYHCVTSSEVVREASAGDAEMSRMRLAAIETLDVLKVGERVLEIATAIIEEGILPPKVLSDAIHATMAATHGADILLTWNCRHLANPELLPGLRSFMERRGLRLPEVCTPVELLAESGDEG